MTQPPSAPPDKDKPDQPTELVAPQSPELPDSLTAAPPPPPAPAAPATKRRIWPYITLAVVVVLGLIVAGGWYVLRDALQEEVPVVDQCLDNAASPDDMEVVDCGSAAAAWIVVGNDGTWTRGDFDAAGPGEVCAEFARTEQALWVTSAARVQDQTTGEVICLAPAG